MALSLKRLRGDRKAPLAAPVRIEPPPAIGLALGGGAARGFAHIGVIRALRNAGFKVDMVAGTSIGAVVGAFHAAGRLDALADWGLSLTRRDVFGLVDLAISGSALMGGSRLAHLLEREIGLLRIEDLGLPFAAVATEVGTGHEVWLTRGLVIPALRASYALPGILPATRVGGRWLMDGALANPVPVTVARVLGARLVIAVSLNAEALARATIIQGHGTSPEDELLPVVEPRPRVKAMVSLGRGLGRALTRPLKRVRRQTRSGDAPVAGLRAPTIPTMMARAFNASQERIARARLAGDPPNVLIGPRLSHIGLFDFHRTAEAIARGEEAAQRLIPDIEAALRAMR